MRHRRPLVTALLAASVMYTAGVAGTTQRSVSARCVWPPAKQTPHNCVLHEKQGTCGPRGLLLIEFVRKADPVAVVRDHGGRARDLEQHLAPPFDDYEVEAGLDRFYLVTVPIGREVAKVSDYMMDERVAYADLAPGDRISVGITPSAPCEAW